MESPVPNKARPVIEDQGDAIVRITTSTICGTDLHILKGDLPAVSDARILGHEGMLLLKRLPNLLERDVI